MPRRSACQRKARHKTKKRVTSQHWQANMPEFFTMLPPEIIEHIYFFLTNKELMNVSTVNRYLQGSIRVHELPLRALQHIQKKLVQSGETNFYQGWAKEIDIQKDTDLILKIANKIKKNQECSQHKTTAYKVSEKITRLINTRQFLPNLVIFSMVYLLATMGVPLIHMRRVFAAKNASSHDIANDPYLLNYADKGYFELGVTYFSFAIIGAILIGLATFVLAVNELYKKFSCDHETLQEKIKKMTLEKESTLLLSVNSFFFTKKIEPHRQKGKKERAKFMYGRGGING